MVLDPTDDGVESGVPPIAAAGMEPGATVRSRCVRDDRMESIRWMRRKPLSGCYLGLRHILL